MKQVRTDFNGIDAHGFEAGIGDVDVRTPPRSRIGEGRASSPVVQEVDGREMFPRQSFFAVLFPQHDELLRVAVRQRTQDNGVDRAEDGGRGTGTHTKRQDGNGGEGG